MSGKVLLTGISGWIAKHTAIELLNSGYEVLGTVRNDSLIEQTKETISKHAPIDNLSFVELDLLKDDGWNEAAQGCKYVMHVASPFPYKVSNNRDSLLAPAVDGTLRVLNAGINANVEQIIKTSSIVAMFRKPNRSNPYTFGENDWTDENWTKGVTDYFLSKTKAERLAWELMESKGLKNKLTTINLLPPTLVFPIQATCAFATSFTSEIKIPHLGAAGNLPFINCLTYSIEVPPFLSRASPNTPPGLIIVNLFFNPLLSISSHAAFSAFVFDKK